MTTQPRLPGLDPPVEAGPPLQDLPWPPRSRAMVARLLCHRDPGVALRLRRLAARLVDQPHLLDNASDPDIRALTLADQAVSQDEHRMKAFVRFREIAAGGTRLYVAFYRPEHRVLRRVAPFFRQRFGAMCWNILTPDESALWDGSQLRFGPGAPVDPHAPEAEIEDLWRAYYGAIFNPARSDPATLDRHLPRRYRQQLPEAAIIEQLGRAAAPRVSSFLRSATLDAARFLPSPQDRSLSTLASTARACTACPLHVSATQTVFGEGPPDASVVLVGEQPGDQEDRAGRPFVGPAGEVLDRALREAGLDRNGIYLTNAVKHFHHERRHGMRLHLKPRRSHVTACRAWLDAELATLRPQVIVCLGATAAQALLGPTHRLIDSRGRLLRTSFAPALVTTYHPSAVLRAEGPHALEVYQALVADLALARGCARGG